MSTMTTKIFTKWDIAEEELYDFLHECQDNLDRLNANKDFEDGEYTMDMVHIIPFDDDGRLEGHEDGDWMDAEKILEDGLNMKELLQGIKEDGGTGVEFYVRYDIEWEYGDSEPSGEEELIQFNIEGEVI